MAGTASGGARQSKWGPYLLVAPGVLWLLVFYVIPLITLGKTSVTVVDGPWWSGFHRAFTAYGDHFGRSVKYALLATLFGIALGYPLAYLMAFRAGRFKNLLLGLVILPFFTTEKLSDGTSRQQPFGDALADHDGREVRVRTRHDRHQRAVRDHHALDAV